MVAFAQLFVTLAILSAAVLAEETSTPKADSVDAKWWGGYRYGGYGAFNYGTGYRCGVPWVNTWYPTTSAYAYLPYRYSTWLKEVNNAAAARRSLNLDQLTRRGEAPVACKSQDGKVDHLVPEDCRQAVRSLVAKKASLSNCNSCSVQLVSANGPISPAEGTPVAALEKVADQALKACGTSSSNNVARSPAEAAGKDQGFALVFSKGDQSTCNK